MGTSSSVATANGNLQGGHEVLVRDWLKDLFDESMDDDEKIWEGKTGLEKVKFKKLDAE